MNVLEFIRGVFGNNPVEWTAVVFGIISVYLSVRENVWSWPTAIVNVSLYVYIFLGARLYADMGLQVFYIGISFYGWWNWLYGGENHTELHVTRLPRRMAVILAAGGIAGAAALGTLLHRTTNADFPYIDSTLTVASLIAQYLMTRKVLENWVIWVVADVAYIGMYFSKELYPTAFLYSVFLVLATMGYFQWKRSWLNQQAVEIPA
ncbi:MAG TPA: nicotinamide riboside transporter PnuC [Longimicrobium sp.]|nr:nicotinamide riboside transporter PnuC [Longimicrobium sp.]